jgi:hypothetical protein
VVPFGISAPAVVVSGALFAVDHVVGGTVTSSRLGSGSLISQPGLPAVIGSVDTARVGAGAGAGTVPGALQDTVTSRAGSLPQVSSSCSGSG